MTRRASLRLEHPRLFIGHRETVLHVLGGRLALLVTIRGRVCVGLGWMGWICACVALGWGWEVGGWVHMCSFNHKADARVTSRLAPSKSCLHWLWPTIKEGVKLEAPSPPSPNNTPDRPVPAAAPPHHHHHHHKHAHASPPTHSPPPSPSCSALPLPLSTTTRPSASFLSEVSSPPPPPA